MNDAHDDHESVIKTPQQLIVAIAAAFIVPIIIIVLLVQYVTGEKKIGAGSQAQSPEAVAARINPIADAGYLLKDANGPKVLLSGEAVFTATCAGCHTAGLLGSPKVGDAGAWSARVAQGYDTLVKHAIQGIRGMPAKGGNADLDDDEVARAVVFMANQSGGKLKEPAVKVIAASATAVK